MNTAMSLWDLQQPLRTLYALCVEPVCQNYGVSRTELDILLFLENNPDRDTAAEIVDRRRLAKSHVSTSIRALEQGGYLVRRPGGADRRLIHLELSEKAAGVIRDGRKARDVFLGILTAGLSGEEKDRLHGYTEKMERNVLSYLEQHESNRKQAG